MPTKLTMKRMLSKEQIHAAKLVEQMESRELVTPFRLFIVLIISAGMVTALSFSAANTEHFVYTSREDDINLTKSPYVFNFQQAMKIREENLEFYNLPSHQWSVERRSDLTLEEFSDIYDCKWPVIVKDVADKWPAMSWTKKFFFHLYGQESVMVKVMMEGQATVHPAKMERFIRELNHTAYHNTDYNSWLYLEDELFIVSRPDLREFIGPNMYAAENFFNLFPEEVKPWDCLLLWGSKYSRSSLHMDPYNWTATNAVLYGNKQWKLFPPGQDDLLYIYTDRKCHFPLDCKKYDSPVDAFDPDYSKYPKFKKAQYITAELTAGEMLIIPTGWYHQAYNSAETLAISSQIMNRNNYLVVLEEIIKGKNIKRNKLPAHFNTLLPPDQVKVFMSLLHRNVLKNGKELTENLLKNTELEKKKKLS